MQLCLLMDTFPLLAAHVISPRIVNLAFSIDGHGGIFHDLSTCHDDVILVLVSVHSFKAHICHFHLLKLQFLSTAHVDSRRKHLALTTFQSKLFTFAPVQFPSLVAQSFYPDWISSKGLPSYFLPISRASEDGEDDCIGRQAGGKCTQLFLRGSAKRGEGEK